MKKHGLFGWLRQAVSQAATTAKHTSAPTRKDNTKRKTPSNIEHHRVAGIGFRTKEVKALGVANPDYKKTKKQLIDAGLVDQSVYEYNFSPAKAELVPEPDNPHDPKAIKVIVAGQHIGYIKSGSCAHIHKLLQADQIASVTCQIGGGRYKYLTLDEDEARYTLESDESSFSAKITILKKD